MERQARGLPRRLFSGSWACERAAQERKRAPCDAIGCCQPYINPILQPVMYEQPASGFLLFGPPGTGKTERGLDSV